MLVVKRELVDLQTFNKQLVSIDFKFNLLVWLLNNNLFECTANGKQKNAFENFYGPDKINGLN